MRIRIKELKEEDLTLATVTLSACAVTTEASLQHRRQLDFRAQALTKENAVKVNYLTDTEASAYAFVNAAFAMKHKLPKIALSKPCKLRLANDKLAPDITHMALITIIIENHVEDL